MRRFMACVLCAAIVQSPASLRAQQASVDRARTIQGARVGVRNEDPNAPGISRDMRTIRRLPTRIDSRIATRVERYADPDRALWAYAAAPDDGSRRSTTADIAPLATVPAQPPTPTPDDGSNE